MAGRRRGARRPQKARLIVAAGAAILVAWGAAIVVAQVGGGSEEPAAVPEAPVEAREIARGDTPPCGAGKVCVTAEYDWDIYDGRFLAFFSDNVFSGRVVERTGTATAWTSIPGDDETPYTRYAVLVEEVAKASGPDPQRPADQRPAGRPHRPRSRARTRRDAAGLPRAHRAAGRSLLPRRPGVSQRGRAVMSTHTGGRR